MLLTFANLNRREQRAEARDLAAYNPSEGERLALRRARASERLRLTAWATLVSWSVFFIYGLYVWHEVHK